MLCRRFCVPFFFFCVFFLFQVNSKTSFAAASPGYDLGVICVTAPAWNHPEEITGNADAEEFFEAVLFSGQTSVSEALDGLMGINLRTSGGLGHISGMSFGGLSGNKILIVKDGLPINDPFTGSPDISAFPLLQFERAQLWQGNRATIWGSNSIGGTIRLTSRFPDHGRFRLWSDGSGGNGQSTEARIYDTDNTRIGFRVGRFSTPGFSSAATAVGNGERDGFSHETGYLSIESNLKNRFQLQLSAETSKSLTDLDDFAGGVPVDSTSFRQQKVGNQFNIGLTRTQKNGELRITHVFNHSNTSGIDESNIFNEYGLETSRQMQTISQSLHNRETSGLIEFSRGETMARNHGVFSIRETEAEL
jgi:outer membrane cobalamin receptor